jgi:hypothetical protein
VGTADRLRQATGERVAEVLDSAATPPGDIYVSWGAALAARTCPARYRGEGEQRWAFPGWSAPLAAGPVGRAALAHHLAESDRRGGPPDLPVPLDAVRAWMRAQRTAPALGGPLVDRSSVGDWVVAVWDDRDTATLAAVAATAGRWLAGFLRVLGWPLPDGLTLLNAGGVAAAGAPAWRPARQSPVTVAPGADARLGRVTGAGRFALVVHRVSTDGDGALRDRAAFEAAAGALAVGVAAEAVLVTAGDTGERVRIPVDGELLEHGAQLVVDVIAERVRAVERGFDPADATPSPACRWCERLEACPPGQSWMRHQGRWRGGLPALR